MKRFLLVTACLVLAPVVARSADVQWITPVEIPSGIGRSYTWGLPYDWTGSYIGLSAGYTLGNTRADFAGFPEASFAPVIPPIPRSADLSGRGFIGGAQLGYNYQIGKLVIGTESDFSWISNPATSASSGVILPGTVFATPFTLALAQKLNWFSTTRLRLGVTPVDRVLIYGTGGLAAGEVIASTTLSFPTVSYIGLESSMRVGWTVGGGAEYTITNNLTVRAEYLHYNLGGATAVGLPSPLNPPFETHTHFGVSGHIVRAGLNYKINWLPPWSRPAPGLVAKASPSAKELVVETGARYWYSTGKTAKNLYGFDGATLLSRLTYSDLTAHAAESFFRFDHWAGFFAKGYLGTGVVTNGNLKDEDFFPPTVMPYSATSSGQKDGSLVYYSADVGYNFLRGQNYRLGGFVGFHVYRERVNAQGCIQTATNPSICATPISGAIQAITNEGEWHSLRLGLNGSVMLSERLQLSADAAWVPYTWLNSQDSHWLRIGSDLGGPVPEDGKGRNGLQLEGVLSYQVTPKLSVGVGGRYWRLDTTGRSHFEVVTSNGGPQPLDFHTERYGGFVQAAFRF